MTEKTILFQACRTFLFLLPIFLSGCPAGGGDGALLLPPGLLGQTGLSCAGAAWPFVDNGGPGAYLADAVDEAPGATGAGFGDANRAVNGVCGSPTAASLDVYSLKFSGTSTKCNPNEKCIVLDWVDRRVLNGAGTDFVVFENPFNRASGGRFIEAVIVEVSEDGTFWCGWNPAYSGEKNSAVAQFSFDIYDVTEYVDVAGLEPVLFDQSTWTGTAADVFDVVKAGGDHFDLADLSGCQGIKDDGFVYLRLTTANSRSPASFPLPEDSFDQTADIDGVVARNVADR